MIGGGVMCLVTVVLGGPEIISSSKLTMACSCSKSSDGRNVSVVTIGNGSSTTLNGMVVVVGVSAFFKDGWLSSSFLLLLIFFFFSFSTGGIVSTNLFIADNDLLILNPASKRAN